MEERMWEIVGVVVFFGIGWILATGVGKTQWVRLVDILVYGPYLVYLGLIRSAYTFSEWERTGLLFLGATTISYNLRNYIGA